MYAFYYSVAFNCELLHGWQGLPVLPLLPAVPHGEPQHRHPRSCLMPNKSVSVFMHAQIVLKLLYVQA